MKTGKINWNKLDKHKKSIMNYYNYEGLDAAIDYSKGILGLQYGEFTKYKPRIRRKLREFRKENKK